MVGNIKEEREEEERRENKRINNGIKRKKGKLMA